MYRLFRSITIEPLDERFEFSAEVKARIALHRPFLAVERDLEVEIS